jgi:bifunctional UDP-N-acetylglucosamine pyrophosphorylase/glucosamine-1-phosphate N-acetyltransferase
LRDGAGRFLRIVEERDCSPEERAIREINPSCYAFELPGLWDALDRLDTGNAQGEYYLTDAPQLLQSMGRRVVALPCLEPDDILGVNTRQHLAQAHAILQNRIQDRLMDEGVSIVDPRNTYIDGRAEIGRDSVIYPFSVITGNVQVGIGCKVGPFAHLRDGTILEDGVEVGAFVEVNRSTLGEGSKARHLAYLGDAKLGRSVNVGAGVITANFDGKDKHPSMIGDGAFLGSGSILVAPVNVGSNAVVGAGAVVTRNHDVLEGQTVIGVPARPIDDRKG